jgi:uncharacterized OB-fold protein
MEPTHGPTPGRTEWGPQRNTKDGGSVVNDDAKAAIAEGLFTGPVTAPQLIGGCCGRCGQWHFPAQENCPHCAALEVERRPLSRRGKLWTWTIQGFAPPVPPYRGAVMDFVPFGVGYLELPEGLCVQGRLTVNDAAALAIGMPMEVVLQAIGQDASGRTLLGHAFAPVSA